MLSKKLNDPFYWKNKLEALNCLPGGDLPEKDALWQKLHGRLQQKPAANKASWYWIAAGLLPLIIIALLMESNTENIQVKQEVVKEKTIKSTPARLPAPSTETVTLSVAAPYEKKHPVAVNSKAASKTFNDTMKDNEVAVAILPEQTGIDMGTDNIMPPDTAVAVATTAAVKKKLQVVHINELEAYPARFNEPVNYAQAIKFRKNKINNLNVATQQNTIGFKIKLSSKN